MIITQSVELKIRSAKSLTHWKNNGFPFLSLGETITVNIDQLSPHIRTYVTYECDSCKIHKTVKWKNVSTKAYHICHNCSQMKKVSHMNKTRPKGYHPKGKNHWNWNTDREVCRLFYNYSKLVRKITEETYSKYKDRINPNNHPRTKCGITNGYQLDHRISVKKGFDIGLNPKIVGSVSNLQMLPWKENRTKGA